MKLIITGATGFIGRALCRKLHNDYEIIALSRNPEAAQQKMDYLTKTVQWDAKTSVGWADEAEGAFGIINLAGENLGSSRWTKTKKARILNSRLDGINAIVETINRLKKRPAVVILVSAIGYYGTNRDELLDETANSGEGFLAEVCRGVESFAGQIEALGVRCVVIRPGVVLGRGGGALEKFMIPFRFYLGGHFGSGRQWLSWISLDDVVAAIRFLLENEHLRGVFNLTSPQPVTMKEFCVSLGQAMRRPAWLNVPGFVLRLVLGETADEMLLSGQKVWPKRLLDSGFEFKYPDLKKALSDIIN